tara:strand:+ start:206 stop:358 length:153 start_codon:yes stop_codon:yes gene_type:complete
MITIIILGILGVGVWLYFKVINETTIHTSSKKNDFKTTLFREMEKLKDSS